jgi:hypothetical protein
MPLHPPFNHEKHSKVALMKQQRLWILEVKNFMEHKLTSE